MTTDSASTLTAFLVPSLSTIKTISVDTSAAPLVVIKRVYAETDGEYTVGDTFVIVGVFLPVRVE